MTEPSPSTEEFLDELRKNGKGELANYLTKVRKDKEMKGSLTLDRNERIFRHNGDDISTLIDLAVIYGSLWEKEDPAP